MAEQTTKQLSPDSMDKFDRFEAWLRQNGAHFDFLELREYDAPDALPEGELTEEKKNVYSERGVHAKEDIESDTLCMMIPRKCLITLDMGKELPIGQKIVDSNVDLHAPRHIFLMIYILWDRKVNGANSFFHPYYEILPDTFNNVPIFWGPEELKYLEGSFMLSEIEDRNDAIAEDYDDMCRVAPEIEDLCTLDEFKWARIAVTSRNFAFQMDGERMSAMVPHADMLNHKRPCETRWTFDDDLDAFTIRTLVDIPAGGQVFDSYGQKSNHRFLLNYGFSMENNIELDGQNPNQINIELEVSETDPIFQRKMKFWLWEGGPDREEEENDYDEEEDDYDEDDDDDENDNNKDDEDDDEENDENDEATNDKDGYEGFHKDEFENEALAQSDLSVPAITEDEEPPVHADDDSEGEDDDTVDDDAQEYDKQEEYEFDDDDRHKTVRVCASGDENTLLLFSLLRTLACNEEELNRLTDKSIRHSVRTFDEIFEPISLRNELAAMTLLKENVIEHLARFPATIEEDVGDLLDEESYPPFSNRRNAKIQVKGEKEVLFHFLLWAESAIHVINFIENDSEGWQGFEDAIEALQEAEVHWSIVRYCDSVLGAELRADRKEKRRSTTSMSSTISHMIDIIGDLEEAEEEE